MHKRNAILLAALMTLSILPAAEAQTPELNGCITNQVINTLGGDVRYFCEPMDSSFFIQFDQFLAGLDYLEATYPDFIELKQIGTSLGGLPIMFVEVTNELSETPRDHKIQLGYSASIHANEAAGREGMIRMLEDLAAGIGPYGSELQPLLDDEIVNVWFPNPDSWASGDFFNVEDVASRHSCDRSLDPLGVGPGIGICLGFDRHNLAGVDLNREFPSPGLIHKDHTPMSEPESQAVVKELRFSGDHSNLVAGVDLHGMINSQNMIRSIIPNNDYDFRRMVLAVDMLRNTETRVEANPAFAEWNQLDSLEDLVEDTTGLDLGGTSDVALEKPMQWGARWDMIGYTDTGFTSDYLMLSPRSPTGGMGAIGTITEFAYSHVVPNNYFVPKLTDMHVAGVREIVRTQMEMVGRLTTPVLAGTGDVGYAWVEDWVSSDDDPAAYSAGQAFDLNDESTWFDFDQVEYRVNNLNFWRDLNTHSTDDIVPVDAEAFDARQLEGLEHFVITNQALDALSDDDLTAIESWVNDGGHLLLTDSALRFFERAGFGAKAEQINTYLGYSDVQDWDHALMNDVTWGARVTGEGPAIGMNVGNFYPQWVLTTEPAGDLDVVGTTQGSASLGRYHHGEGSIDFIGAALPRPVQVTGDNADHRYGLADYSVSAFTYWLVMNSLGGELAWEEIDEPFVPYYDFDPIYGNPSGAEVADHGGEKDTPLLGIMSTFALLGVAIALRRRN